MPDIDQLIADLSKQASLVKSMPHPLVSLLKWAAGSGIYLALLMAYFGLRSDMTLKLVSPLFLIEIGLLICMILASGLSVALLSFPDMYQKRLAAFAPLVPFMLFIAVLAVEWLERRSTIAKACPWNRMSALHPVLFHFTRLLDFLLFAQNGQHPYRIGWWDRLAGSNQYWLPGAKAVRTNRFN